MTQETNDVVTQLRAKAAWHEFCAADKWDFEEAANLIQSQSARIAELRDGLDAICAMLAGFAGQPNHMGDVYKIADAARSSKAPPIF